MQTIGPIPLLQGGLVLVASAAWGDAGKKIVDYLYPNGGATAMAAIIFAIIITALVILTVYIINIAAAKVESSSQSIRYLRL